MLPADLAEEVENEKITEFDGFVGDVIRMCLKWKPEDRPTAKDLAAFRPLQLLIKQLDYGCGPRNLLHGVDDAAVDKRVLHLASETINYQAAEIKKLKEELSVQKKAFFMISSNNHNPAKRRRLAQG